MVKRKKKEHVRKLWLEVMFYAPGTPANTVRRTLINSIRNRTYKYPSEWKVGIRWRNKENAVMRSGEFTAEMKASARSSEGFDYAVIDYLRRA